MRQGEGASQDRADALNDKITHLLCAARCSWPHAHVKWTISAEAEATLWVVKLRAGGVMGFDGVSQTGAESEANTATKAKATAAATHLH